jgi:hypothetical protein
MDPSKNFGFVTGVDMRGQGRAILLHAVRTGSSIENSKPFFIRGVPTRVRFDLSGKAKQHRCHQTVATTIHKLRQLSRPRDHGLQACVVSLFGPHHCVVL